MMQRPMRCRRCMGATTLLCPVCKARGKIGGLFTGQPLQCCGICSGTGRVTCDKCQGAGMWNSWLWRTDMSRPSDKLTDANLGGGDRDGHVGLKNGSNAGSNGAEAGSVTADGFPYPELEHRKQSFRERVRKQQSS